MTITFERIQHFRQTAAQWTSANTVLLSGELGVETDTGRWKLGNGSTAWTALPYQPGTIDDSTTSTTKVWSSAKTAAAIAAGGGGSGSPTYPTTNTQTGTAYTVVLGDADNIIEYTGSSTFTLTFPTDAAVPVPINSSVEVRLMGTGSIALANASGVLLRSAGGALRLTTQYATAIVQKRATNEWVISGYVVV